MASVILPNTQQGQGHKTITTKILDDMIFKGSVPALFRKTELEQLEQMVRQIDGKAACGPCPVNDERQEGRNPTRPDGPALEDQNNTSLYACELDQLLYEQIFSGTQTFAIGGEGEGMGSQDLDQWLWDQNGYSKG